MSALLQNKATSKSVVVVFVCLLIHLPEYPMYIVDSLLLWPRGCMVYSEAIGLVLAI